MYERFAFGYLIFVMVVAILAFIGWVKNIVWIFHELAFDNGASGEEILSLVGIVIAPIGAIMGWVH